MCSEPSPEATPATGKVGAEDVGGIHATEAAAAAATTAIAIDFIERLAIVPALPLGRIGEHLECLAHLLEALLGDGLLVVGRVRQSVGVALQRHLLVRLLDLVVA